MTSHCPACGTPTELSRTGHPSLCIACTERELGETFAQIQARATAAIAKTRQRKWRR